MDIHTHLLAREAFPAYINIPYTSLVDFKLRLQFLNSCLQYEWRINQENFQVSMLAVLIQTDHVSVVSHIPLTTYVTT